MCLLKDLICLICVFRNLNLCWCILQIFAQQQNNSSCIGNLFNFAVHEEAVSITPVVRLSSFQLISHLLFPCMCLRVFIGGWTRTRWTVTVNCCGWPICWSSTQSPVTLKPRRRATFPAACRDARSQLSLHKSSTAVSSLTSHAPTYTNQNQYEQLSLNSCKYLGLHNRRIHGAALNKTRLNVFEHVVIT